MADLVASGFMAHSDLVQVGAWSRLTQTPGMYDVCLALAVPALAWLNLALRSDLGPYAGRLRKFIFLRK